MKKLGFLQIFAFGLLLLIILPVSSNTYSEQLIEYEPMKIDSRIRDADLEMDASEIFTPAAASPRASGGVINETKIWAILNSYTGYYQFTYFVLRAISPMTEIWVQRNLAFPAGDPRPTPVITDEQLNYLMGEFNSHIYPIDTANFGVPTLLDGTNAEADSFFGLPADYYYDNVSRNVILVSNVRDENYYNRFYPYYIAGFFSSTFKGYFDRNIISIDSHDWVNRVGPNGTRPYLYDGTIAHEFQHLIHNAYNPTDPSFMNEACSMYAEVLCGYPFDWGDIASYLATPDNSLVDWGDQGDINILSDYGQSLLWATYLIDHYGGMKFLTHFVQAGIPGIEGIDATLKYFRYRDRFMEIYHNFRIANLLHFGSGKYNYKSLDFDEFDTQINVTELSGLPIPYTMGTDFGNTFNNIGNDTGISMLSRFGSDYIKIVNIPRRYPLSMLEFFGDDTTLISPVWELGESGWYSGAGDLMNVLLYGEAYVDPTNPILTYYTYWDIEDYWDFAFTQISTDGGETWTSLANENTTAVHDPGAHPDIIANLPGLTSWSQEFVTLSFDLSAYAGQNVLIGFRYMTDWATTYEGWYIQDPLVSDVSISLEPYYPPADFMVTMIEVTEKHHRVMYQIHELYLNDLNDGWNFLFTEQDSYIYLIISSISSAGYVDYGFSIDKIPKHHHPGCH